MMILLLVQDCFFYLYVVHLIPYINYTEMRQQLPPEKYGESDKM